MADSHVRESRPDDAPELGRVQMSVWRQAYAETLPADFFEQVTEQVAADAWRTAITTPPGPGYLVFTAIERTEALEETVGFAAIVPVSDDEPEIDAPTAELSTIMVEPRWGRRGNGSRLLSAVVAGARSMGAERMITWVLASDVVTERFLQSAGWEKDGWTRPLSGAERPMTQHRFATDISHLDDGGAGG